MFKSGLVSGLATVNSGVLEDGVLDAEVLPGGSNLDALEFVPSLYTDGMYEFARR
jgi:hypothetical protein